MNATIDFDEESISEVITLNSEVESLKEDTDGDSQDVTCKSLHDVSSESSPELPPKILAWLPAAKILLPKLNAVITHVDDECCVYFHPDKPECT